MLAEARGQVAAAAADLGRERRHRHAAGRGPQTPERARDARHGRERVVQAREEEVVEHGEARLPAVAPRERLVQLAARRGPTGPPASRRGPSSSCIGRRKSRCAPTGLKSICTPRCAPQVSVSAYVSCRPARKPSGCCSTRHCERTRIGAPRLTIADHPVGGQLAPAHEAARALVVRAVGVHVAVEARVRRAVDHLPAVELRGVPDDASVISGRRLVQPERRALVVLAELEAPEALLGVLVAAVVERHDLAAELLYARERRVHVLDGEEHVGRRARVAGMHPARDARASRSPSRCPTARSRTPSRTGPRRTPAPSARRPRRVRRSSLLRSSSSWSQSYAGRRRGLGRM